MQAKQSTPKYNPQSQSLTHTNVPHLTSNRKTSSTTHLKRRKPSGKANWHIAQVYVALADDEHEQEARASKLKEVSRLLGDADTSSLTTMTNVGLESLAIEKYLDDFEWEEEEIKAGRQPSLPKFPFGDFRSQGNKGCKP